MKPPGGSPAVADYICRRMIKSCLQRSGSATAAQRTIHSRGHPVGVVGEPTAPVCPGGPASTSGRKAFREAHIDGSPTTHWGRPGRDAMAQSLHSRAEKRSTARDDPVGLCGAEAVPPTPTQPGADWFSRPLGWKRQSGIAAVFGLTPPRDARRPQGVGEPRGRLVPCAPGRPGC